MNTGPFVSFAEALAIPESGIASRPLLELKNGTKVVLFALDVGQEISPHLSPFPAEVLVLEGKMKVLVGTAWHEVGPNERIRFPMGHPHGLQALAPSHFMLTMLRSVRDQAELNVHPIPGGAAEGGKVCACGG